MKRRASPDGTDETAASLKRSRAASNKLENLARLLDLTGLTSEPDLSSRFQQIASVLLHQYRIVLAQAENQKESYEVLELEFYLRKDGCHEDPFAHATEEQSLSGNWYFHRSPRRSKDASRSATSTTGYRGGTRKGMDLTFGGPVDSKYFAKSKPAPSLAVRGGVLLRSMRRCTDSTLISGPSLLVDEILRRSGASSISDLVQNKWSGDTSALSARKHFPSLYFEQRSAEDLSSSPVYSSPRIGLDLGHPGTTASVGHPRVTFVSRPYRYFVSPSMLTANGRIQTFIGILAYHLHERQESPISSRSISTGHSPVLSEDSELCQDISTTTGIKIPTVKNYVEDYEIGRAKGTLSQFAGQVGKGVGRSPARYLRMMGTLDRVLAPVHV
jgi:hypothetical protein